MGSIGSFFAQLFDKFPLWIALTISALIVGLIILLTMGFWLAAEKIFPGRLSEWSGRVFLMTWGIFFLGLGFYLSRDLVADIPSGDYRYVMALVFPGGSILLGYKLARSAVFGRYFVGHGFLDPRDDEDQEKIRVIEERENQRIDQEAIAIFSEYDKAITNLIFKEYTTLYPDTILPYNKAKIKAGIRRLLMRGKVDSEVLTRCYIRLGYFAPQADAHFVRTVENSLDKFSPDDRDRCQDLALDISLRHDKERRNLSEEIAEFKKCPLPERSKAF